MTIRLKRPQWVISDEGWEFYSKDRFYMEYVENESKFIIEVDDSPVSPGIYMDTLKPVDSNIVITDEDEKIIKERIAIAFRMMEKKGVIYR